MQGSQQKYRLKDWQETVLFERPDGVKVTRVDAEFAYEGDLTGDTRLSYLMQYDPGQTGRYSGWEAFQGTYLGAPAEILLRHEGRFDPEGVDAHVVGLDGTGTGSLDRRKVGFDTRFTGEGPYELTLQVEQVRDGSEGR